MRDHCTVINCCVTPRSKTHTQYCSLGAWNHMKSRDHTQDNTHPPPTPTAHTTCKRHTDTHLNHLDTWLVERHTQLSHCGQTHAQHTHLICATHLTILSSENKISRLVITHCNYVAANNMKHAESSTRFRTGCSVQSFHPFTISVSYSRGWEGPLVWHNLYCSRNNREHAKTRRRFRTGCSFFPPSSLFS